MGWTKRIAGKKNRREKKQNRLIPNDFLILIAACRLSRPQHSFQYAAAVWWNKLSDDIAKSHAFSGTVYKYLLCR